MTTNLKDIQKNSDKTFILNVTLKKGDIQKEYQETLKSVQSTFETKGFRKGKVPLNIVEQQVSSEKIIEEILSKLLSDVYEKKIKEHDLKPIIQPKIQIKNPPINMEKDWEIGITGCEMPEIAIDDKYTSKIADINKEDEKDKDKKLNKILETLTKSIKIELPSMLIESDIESRLSQLVDQTNQAGITVNQYLKNKNTTLEQYKDQIKTQITQEWTLNLAITKIAKDQKLEVTEEDIKSFVSKNPTASSNVNLVYFVLTQQKVFEYLQNLK